MGALWRADCHGGEVKVGNRVGGDGGGDWRFKPVRVGTVDEVSGSEEAQTHNKQPCTLASFTLRYDGYDEQVDMLILLKDLASKNSYCCRVL